MVTKHQQYLHAKRIEKILHEKIGKGTWLYKWVEKHAFHDDLFLTYLSDQTKEVKHYLAIICIYKENIRSKNIYSASRSKVLKYIIKNCPNGLHKIIRRMQDRVWEKRNYINLINILQCETGNKYLSHKLHLTERYIESISSLKQTFWGLPILFKLKNRPQEIYLKYYISVLIKNLPECCINDMHRSISKVSKFEELQNWFYIWSMKIPRDEFIWKGDKRIKPIKTITKLRKISRKYQNCLESFEYQMISGNKRFMEWKNKNTRAVIELKKDHWGDWYSGRIEGPKYAPIDKESIYVIERLLEKEGYCKLPDEDDMVDAIFCN